ncbi:hypothetical protein SAMN04488535_0871 [Corynebacterium mycetoides]|uniref:Uncharacterized protein n=1 Tax=Corynebacterium mycetoides TaxID=38302 RepID=A0A1G9N6W4_9CORY|nr:hypothetical protein [Corynebacterium mycetoides]SDL81575.1 hypothetical protein SAMN04488535_0871 [Corynebacterium mycetoides]
MPHESQGSHSFSVAGGMWVLVCFLVAGLLIGGVWSAYTNGSKVVAAVLAVAAAIALVVAFVSMARAMG